MSFQGKHSSRVDEEIMEILGLQLQKLLVRLSDKGFNLKWNNNEIISWYSAEGAKLKSKSKYKKIPAAIVYLLRRNDIATITENEKTITNIKEIERVRSDELEKLRKQVEVFAYEQQGWARQREEMATKVDHVQGKLITYSNYISALEDCCDKTSFPVAAVKQAALDETELETQTESEDDDTALACNIRPQRETRNRALVSLWPEKLSLRSPIKTRTKSNDSPKKAVKIAVLKTMTNADDEITTIKFLTSAGTPIKHFNIITSIWQEIRARDSSLSIVKVRAHIIKNPDENEKNNNIADQLAKLAAQKGDEWKPDRLVVPAVSAIQTIPIDLKQYQQELWSSDGELTPHLQQDQLVKVTEGMILRDDKYIVPEALQKPVIKLYHDYAHVSAPKTQQLIQKNFWWPQMASDIQRWCDTCIVCATINQGKPGRTKLCRPEPPKGPWELLQLDFIGPLPSAKGGYRYCLVIIDKFSKWVEAIPTRNNSANTVARVVANQILPLWGAPIQIESDQGTHFTGQVMKQICQMLNIKQRFHVPYRPQSSGMVERANRTIKESISKQVAQHKNQWIDALPTVLTILRATPSKATGISPFELMTGRVMKLPIDPEIAPADLGPLVVATQQSVLKQLRERLEVLHARAALKQQQSDLTNDTQFNPTSEVKFSEGDIVMVWVFVKQGAFTPRWHGPYEVKAICNSCVATTVKGKLRWYHMSQCKSFKNTQNK